MDHSGPGTTPFFCDLCHACYPDAGECKGCPGEPLFDLREEGVQEMIREEDHRRFSARSRKALKISILATSVAFVGVLSLAYMLLGERGVLTLMSSEASWIALLGALPAAVLIGEKVGVSIWPSEQLAPSLFGDEPLTGRSVNESMKIGLQDRFKSRRY